MTERQADVTTTGNLRKTSKKKKRRKKKKKEERGKKREVERREYNNNNDKGKKFGRQQPGLLREPDLVPDLNLTKCGRSNKISFSFFD